MIYAVYDDTGRIMYVLTSEPSSGNYILVTQEQSDLISAAIDECRVENGVFVASIKAYKESKKNILNNLIYSSFLVKIGENKYFLIMDSCDHFLNGWDLMDSYNIPYYILGNNSPVGLINFSTKQEAINMINKINKAKILYKEYGIQKNQYIDSLTTKEDVQAVSFEDFNFMDATV